MKTILVLMSLISLPAFASTEVRNCEGFLKRQETKAFGGRLTASSVNWQLSFDDATKTLTIKDGDSSVSGPFVNSVLKIQNEDQRGQVKLTSVTSDNEKSDDEFFDVVMTQQNSSGAVVSQSSGLIRCAK